MKKNIERMQLTSGDEVFNLGLIEEEGVESTGNADLQIWKPNGEGDIIIKRGDVPDFIEVLKGFL